MFQYIMLDYCTVYYTAPLNVKYILLVFPSPKEVEDDEYNQFYKSFSKVRVVNQALPLYPHF